MTPTKPTQYPQLEPVLLRLCGKVNRVDDRLGQRSDHEGTKHGPTYILFNDCNASEFTAICEEQMHLHREGIKIWRQLKRLKQNTK